LAGGVNLYVQPVTLLAVASETAGSLQPRYRRLLSFGAVLDESMLLFRRHWITFALVSSISLLPPSLVLVWLSGAGLSSRTVNMVDFRTGRLANPAALDEQMAQFLGLTAYLVVYSLFGLLWSAAIVLSTDAYLHGEQPSVGRVYRRSIRRYVAVFLGTLLFTLGTLALILLAAILFVLTGVGVVGSLIAIIGLLFWWFKPDTRKTWLKWLIILTAPFGLLVYVATQWGMYLPAAVLEDKGPVAALSRSAELTERYWFRVAGALTVSSAIVWVMLSVLSSLVTIPFTVAALFRGQIGLSPTEAVISNGVTSVATILLASIGPIVYTVLFVDLRNRREGTDIAERLSRLEASPLPANG
jgi:hypothetical protein